MGGCATKPATVEGEAPLPAEEEAKAAAEAESGQQSLNTLLSRDIEVEVKETIPATEAKSTEPAATEVAVADAEAAKADDKKLAESPAEPPKEKAADGDKEEKPAAVVAAVSENKGEAAQLPVAASSVSADQIPGETQNLNPTDSRNPSNPVKNQNSESENSNPKQFFLFSMVQNILR